jgi:hypothetical protein
MKWANIWNKKHSCINDLVRALGGMNGQGALEQIGGAFRRKVHQLW